MTSKKARITPRNVFVSAFSMLLFVLIIKYSSAAIVSVKSALALCAETVIPSLFPFMVIAEIAVSLDVAKYLGKILSPVFRPLFNLNEDGACAFLLGTLCGFPVGAKSAVSLYKRKRLTEKELSHVLCFCNNPSSAFVISAVGVSLFGSHSFGIALYVITLMSAIIIGLCLRFVFGSKGTAKKEQPKKSQDERRFGIHIFTNAVTDAAGAMLAVCGFIVFFSALLGTLNEAFAPLSAPEYIVAATKGFFELTSGVTHVAVNLRGEGALLLCAFIVGWSGLSVHFQIMAICKGCDISFRPYFLSKAAQGGLNALITCAYLRIFKPKISFSTDADRAAFLSIPKPFVIISLSFFAVAIIALGIKKATKKRKKQANF